MCLLSQKINVYCRLTRYIFNGVDKNEVTNPTEKYDIAIARFSN
jgi:hypothetical protein